MKKMVPNFSLKTYKKSLLVQKGFFFTYFNRY